MAIGGLVVFPGVQTGNFMLTGRRWNCHTRHRAVGAQKSGWAPFAQPLVD
jgi:hypothetical protein